MPDDQPVSSEPAAPPQPKPGSSRLQRALAFIRNHGVMAAATVIVTVLTPFLVVSESTTKKYVEGWLNDCVLVFEVDKVQDRENRLLITGYAQGKLPDRVPVTFSASKAEINSIQFINPIERDADRYASLAVHPLVNQTCPGQLCENQGNLLSSVHVTIPLTDLHPSFAYRFHVDFNANVTTDGLRVYVQYDPGFKEVCRVERANPFNLFVRSSKLGQFGLAVIVFVSITVLIAAARALLKGDTT